MAASEVEEEREDLSGEQVGHFRVREVQQEQRRVEALLLRRLLLLLLLLWLRLVVGQLPSQP